MLQQEPFATKIKELPPSPADNIQLKTRVSKKRRSKVHIDPAPQTGLKKYRIRARKRLTHGRRTDNAVNTR